MLTATGERIVIRPEGYEEANGSPQGEEGEDSEKDDRYPKITKEDWIARERARKLLKNILSRQAERRMPTSWKSGGSRICSSNSNGMRAKPAPPRRLMGTP
jgi:hypothetical protein